MVSQCLTISAAGFATTTGFFAAGFFATVFFAAAGFLAAAFFAGAFAFFAGALTAFFAGAFFAAAGLGARNVLISALIVLPSPFTASALASGTFTKVALTFVAFPLSASAKLIIAMTVAASLSAPVSARVRTIIFLSDLRIPALLKSLEAV